MADVQDALRKVIRRSFPLAHGTFTAGTAAIEVHLTSIQRHSLIQMLYSLCVPTLLLQQPTHGGKSKGPIRVQPAGL